MSHAQTVPPASCARRPCAAGTSYGARSFRNRLVAGAQGVFGVESPLLLELGAKPRLPNRGRNRTPEEKVADLSEGAARGCGGGGRIREGEDEGLIPPISK